MSRGVPAISRMHFPLILSARLDINLCFRRNEGFRNVAFVVSCFVFRLLYLLAVLLLIVFIVALLLCSRPLCFSDSLFGLPYVRFVWFHFSAWNHDAMSQNCRLPFMNAWPSIYFLCDVHVFVTHFPLARFCRTVFMGRSFLLWLSFDAPWLGYELRLRSCFYYPTRSCVVYILHWFRLSWSIVMDFCLVLPSFCVVLSCRCQKHKAMLEYPVLRYSCSPQDPSCFPWEPWPLEASVGPK